MGKNKRQTAFDANFTPSMAENAYRIERRPGVQAAMQAWRASGLDDNALAEKAKRISGAERLLEAERRPTAVYANYLCGVASQAEVDALADVGDIRNDLGIQ